MKEDKHGSRELPPANLKFQIWIDPNRKPPFAIRWPNLDHKVSIGYPFFLSLLTIPEGFAKVNSVQFSSSRHVLKQNQIFSALCSD